MEQSTVCGTSKTPFRSIHHYHNKSQPTVRHEPALFHKVVEVSVLDKHSFDLSGLSAPTDPVLSNAHCSAGSSVYKS